MRRTLLGLAMLAALGLAPVRAMADDDQIAQAIVTKFKAQKTAGSFKDFKIGVKVEEGVVTLEGFVPNQSQLDLALDIARRVKGVKMVVNDIQLDTSRESKAQVSVPANDAAADKALAEAEKSALEVPSSRRVTGALKIKPVSAPVEKLDEVEGAGLATEAVHTEVSPKHVDRAAAIEPTPAAAPAPIPAAVKPQASRPARSQTPLAMAPSRTLSRGGIRQASAEQAIMTQEPAMQPSAAPVPSYVPANGMGVAPAQYDHPQMPNYAWPSYASHPNYAAVTYPRQYSPSAWPYIGPFYPYPQVPLGWRKVTLEWDDGWWYLDFKNRHYR